MSGNLKTHDESPISWVEQNNSGNDNAEAVIFLHAMAGSRTAWMPQLEALSKTYRCIAWDMPGFGSSDEASEDMDMDDVVEALANFTTKTLGLKSAHFVGLSVGGMILQHFAAKHQGLAKSISILDSSPKFGYGGSMQPSEFADPILEQLKGGITPAKFSDGMIRAIVGSQCSEAIKLEAIAAMSRVSISGLALTTRLIADHDALEKLSSITCPTLVMAGQDDGETPPVYAYEIGSRIKGASITIIPDAGHIVNLENPEPVTKRLKFFLENQI